MLPVFIAPGGDRNKWPRLGVRVPLRIDFGFPLAPPSTGAADAVAIPAGATRPAGAPPVESTPARAGDACAPRGPTPAARRGGVLVAPARTHHFHE